MEVFIYLVLTMMITSYVTSKGATNRLNTKLASQLKIHNDKVTEMRGIIKRKDHLITELTKEINL